MITVDPCNGVEDIGASSFRISPNPSSGIFRLNPGNNRIQIKEINVYNVVGTLVMSTVDFENIPEIDLSDQPNGYYILKVIVEDDMEIYQLIKE